MSTCYNVLPGTQPSVPILTPSHPQSLSMFPMPCTLDGSETIRCQVNGGDGYCDNELNNEVSAVDI